MTEAETDRSLVVAAVVAPHGVRGELKCRLVTDFPDRFEPGLRLTAWPQASAPGPPRVVTVRSARVAGAFVYLSLESVDTRDAAEQLRGAELLVAPEDAVRLPPGQFFWREVIGLRVEDTLGAELGTVAEILPTGANDVYVVRGPRGEILIPAIKDVLRDIDPAAGRIVVELMPGLVPDPPATPRRRPGRAARQGRGH